MNQSISSRVLGEEDEKVAESKKPPMNPVDAANYMKQNFMMAQSM